MMVIIMILWYYTLRLNSTQVFFKESYKKPQNIGDSISIYLEDFSIEE